MSAERQARPGGDQGAWGNSRGRGSAGFRSSPGWLTSQGDLVVENVEMRVSRLDGCHARAVKRITFPNAPSKAMTGLESVLACASLAKLSRRRATDLTTPILLRSWNRCWRVEGGTNWLCKAIDSRRRSAKFANLVVVPITSGLKKRFLSTDANEDTLGKGRAS